METFFLALALLLLATLLAGLAVVARARTGPDAMLAAQLFGTTGVAVLLLLAEARAAPALRNVALVFALLGAVAVVVFVRRVLDGRRPDGKRA
jgi:multicomponent Na+:H+ antiporter subunit F